MRSKQRIYLVGRLRRPFGRRVGCVELLGRVARLLRRRHQLQSRLLQREIARPPGKPVEQGLGVDADIVRHGEHPGVACHSAHAPRRRVIHGAPEQVIEIGILAGIGSALLITCRRCDARQQAGAPCVSETVDPRTGPGNPGDRGSPHRVRTAGIGRGKVPGLVDAEWPEYVL